MNEVLVGVEVGLDVDSDLLLRLRLRLRRLLGSVLRDVLEVLVGDVVELDGLLVCGRRRNLDGDLATEGAVVDDEEDETNDAHDDAHGDLAEETGVADPLGVLVDEERRDEVADAAAHVLVEAVAGVGALEVGVVAAEDGGHDGLVVEKLGFNNFISKNDCPNGQNINKDCGSTYLENDKNKEKRLILALDGDGDRFIGSYNSYKIDGEILCYLLINLYNDKFKNGIVSTPLTNRKIVQAITKEGIPYYESKVGDSNVFDLMIKKHCKFGFEASGHLLFSSYSDGILSSLIFLSLLEKDENKIKKLLKDLKLNHFKQLNYSLKNTDEFIFNITHSDIYKSLISYIKPGGRILFRKSGTEDLCRIILESRSKKAIKKVQKEIEKYIEDKRCVE